MKGIALKVTYNDGGAEGSLFGFRGTCSNQNMFVNVRVRKMTNCSDNGKPCREYVDANFTGRRPTETGCYERQVFAKKRFEFGCGMYHHGSNAGKPISVHRSTSKPGRGGRAAGGAMWRESDSLRLRPSGQREQ